MCHIFSCGSDKALLQKSNKHVAPLHPSPTLQRIVRVLSGQYVHTPILLGAMLNPNLEELGDYL